MMKTQKLGYTGVEVSSLCLGAMYLGTRNDYASSCRLLDQYLDAGGSFIDRANIYAHWVQGFHGGESETLLGQWMQERSNRSKLFMVSKVRFQYADVPKRLRAGDIEAECNKSLQRRGVETIDLYYAHVDDHQPPLRWFRRVFALKLGKPFESVLHAREHLHPQTECVEMVDDRYIRPGGGMLGWHNVRPVFPACRNGARTPVLETPVHRFVRERAVQAIIRKPFGETVLLERRSAQFQRVHKQLHIFQAEGLVDGMVDELLIRKIAEGDVVIGDQYNFRHGLLPSDRIKVRTYQKVIYQHCF
jgi:hypothetical protein